ncbi:Hsp20/alpha crystallin family protein [Parachryseolinea silvisoli]|jgi:HSP20 family protein|uniref:Hsp20/alpha crystallin family protein n=1 Tax=Parachryseolinea silvisoli TaxID=2873601 RepID=UPI002265CB8F|nr:Hsp20/alpha crystallin family protein [Parachryseolinea silvisoli]MCD9015125.1 Hsp20/alpha crystallin family protein [Parachryseolinea silvisoli]
MNLTLRKNGGLPSLLSDFFGSSLVDRDFFDLDSDMFASRLGINVPTANIVETPKEFTLELAAPGLERKDFNVVIENHMLKISADKKEEKSEKHGGYSRQEYSFNSFIRTFALPENVKEGNVDAKYENGVLRVSIPKSKESNGAPVHKVAVS